MAERKRNYEEERDREKVLDRLKKMYEHAKSAKDIGSEAEAAAFAEKLQQLLTIHKVEMSELESKEEDLKIVESRPDYEQFGVKLRKRRIKWLEDLAVIVANAHYCRVLIVTRGSSCVWFVGRPTDVEACKMAYGFLAQKAEEIADKEYVRFFYECKAAGNVRRARGFRDSFLSGFVSRLALRYSEYQENIRRYYSSSGVAIARIKSAFDAIDEYLQKKFADRKAKSAKPLENSVSNMAGWSRGRTKADDVELSPARAKLQ